MSQDTLHIDPVAQCYAKSLLQAALENKAEKNVDSDLAALLELYHSSDDLRATMLSPIFSRDDLIATMDALGKKAKFHKITTNFLKVLAQNGRLAHFADMVQGYKQAYRVHKGEVTVNVSSAYALTKAQEKELSDALKAGLNCNISMTNVVDKDLLGGVVVKVGSLMIDDSVKNKLNRLKKQLKSGTQDNTQLKEVS